MPAVQHKLSYMGTAPKPKKVDKEPSFPLQTGGGYDLAIKIGASTSEVEAKIKAGLTKPDAPIYAGYKKIRRLTPLECERLQSFPDNWTVGFSDTQRYKMMGNAVTVNVINFLAERLFFNL